jgi:hypothetical protein
MITGLLSFQGVLAISVLDVVLFADCECSHANDAKGMDQSLEGFRKDAFVKTVFLQVLSI